MNKKILWFDIETAPEVNGSEFNSYSKKALWEKKMLKEPLTDTFDRSYMQKSSLFPEFAKVVCISYLVEGWEIKSLVGDEREILTKFNLILSTHADATLGGFNIFGFDIPFLWKRMIINAIQPNPLLCIADKKPRDVDVVDVFLAWKQTSFSCSLDTLCLTLLGESPKAGFDASGVAYAFYNDGIEQIRRYCEGDVEFTRRCWWRMQLVNLAEKDKKPDSIPDPTATKIPPTQAPVEPVDVGELLTPASTKKEKMTEEQFLKLQADSDFIRKYPDSESLIVAISAKYEIDTEMRMKIGELRAEENLKQSSGLPF